MTKKEFALSQIAPYYKDPKTCGYHEGLCQYKTADGKMCVLGKNLIEYKKEYEGIDAKELLEYYGEGILKEESRGILSPLEWRRLQILHDTIATTTNSVFTAYINQLGLFTFKELEEYSENL